MNDNRADSFLRLIKKSGRGRLKIYLGYCAGVGKTYQMLLEAHRMVKDGIDVAVGVVETHGRRDTEALLEGLRIIPARRIFYKGIELSELDTDAIIAGKPSVVLVDELAHTNVPGSGNSKRYQDVDEILSAGIHVVTTLNVQHLESLYETVERATGVKVKERLPDRVVAEADQVVNVDLTTQDLRRRLKEGKIYGTERISTALENFFKTVNLEQLREISLREMASHIDSKRRNPLEDQIPSNPDQVMVCLSSRGPNSEALLRYASRLAGRLNRNWYAVYVQTESERPTVIDSETQRLLANALSLAQQLGATVFTYRGDDIVKTILQFAREYRVGHIVIGTPGRDLPFWKRLMGEKGIIERLISEGRGMTVVVLDTRQMADFPSPVAQAYTPSGHALMEPELPVRSEDSWQNQVKSMITADRIMIWNRALEKRAAMEELVGLCTHNQSELLKEKAVNAIMDRENQGSTFFGEEIAIPHASVEGLETPLMALGVSSDGIFEQETGRSMKIMILILSPFDEAEVHLKLLGAASKMVRDELFRKKLIAAGTRGEVLMLIGERML